MRAKMARCFAPVTKRCQWKKRHSLHYTCLKHLIENRLCCFFFQFGVSDMSGLLQLWQVSSTNASSDAFQVNFCERTETFKPHRLELRSKWTQSINFICWSLSLWCLSDCRYFSSSISACWNPISLNLIDQSSARIAYPAFCDKDHGPEFSACNFRGLFKMLLT